jgi:hypothetical protein
VDLGLIERVITTVAMSWVKANRILNSHDKAIAVSKEISGSLSSAQQNGRVMMVSMYDEAPDGDISLEEFERFAVDRLHGRCSGIVCDVCGLYNFSMFCSVARD